MTEPADRWAANAPPRTAPRKRAALIGLVVACAAFGAYILAAQLLDLSHMLATRVDALHAQYADYIAQHRTLVLAAFLAVYFLVMTLSLPLAGTMDLIGGFILGRIAFPIAIFCIGFGSIVPFLIARRVGMATLARFDTALVQRVQRGFTRTAFQYVIIMRLVPWAPVSATTVIAGALGMSLRPFMLATVLGFLPAGFALNSIGEGLRHLSEARNVSIGELYSDHDFLFAALGVVVIVALGFAASLVKGRGGQPDSAAVPHQGGGDSIVPDHADHGAGGP